MTALIDRSGRVAARTRIFERDLAVGSVVAGRETGPTLYARHGDLFAHACTVATVLGSSFAFFRGRKQS